MPSERPIDVAGAAERLGVTERFVRRLIEERRVPFYKVGRLVRFDPAELDAWFEAQRVAPAGEVLDRRLRSLS